MAPNLIHQRRIDSRADDDAALGQEIFDISMAQIESIVEPDGVGDDIGRKSVALISIHRQIISFR